MLNQFGNYSLYIALISSIFLIYLSSRSIKFSNFGKSSTIFSILSVQLLMIFVSFFTLVYAFVSSDFSNQTAFYNSHSTKPLFYKISGTWGNHEGSLLLWLLVLITFLYIFNIKSEKKDKKYKLLTILIQEIVILGFILFILFTSNPFNTLFPIPDEGLGLNPILQDPALAIHPPVLYVGYVGTSIIFSSALAALITNNVNSSWAKHIKNWLITTWIFLTIGILLGSVWAYYELGWGGFWFWDPVENVSLMPWFCLTALIHTIIVLQKRNIFHSWAIILSITTFFLSMSGTFLVRSGILNSIHTFANDPSRGLFILCFLFFLIIVSLILLFFYHKNIPEIDNKIFYFSKETAILINNWFMMFFLSVVLIGTIYPIFLEVVNNSQISIGPPFYHKLIIPFLIPFLLFMSFGPKIKWIKDNFQKVNLKLLLIFLLSILISVYLIFQSGRYFLFSIPLLALSFYLFTVTLKDLMDKKSSINQKISHLGFSLLLLSILLNGLFSSEFSSNMKVGDIRNFENKEIKFVNLQINEKVNFKSLMAKFEVKDGNRIYTLRPELRIYNKPETITSEADISTSLYADNFLVFNILKSDGYFNVRYQHKPFMLWIWLSTILISFGGILTYFRKNV